MVKLSEARKRANAKWDAKNKDRKQYINRRSVAKNFILNMATEEDLRQMEKYIAQRREEL